MKIIKYVLIFSLPILLFINLWRFVNMGDSFNYTGLKDTANYISTFPGFENFYSAFTSWNTEFSYGFWDGVADFFTGGVASLCKALYQPLQCIFGAITDIVNIIVWFVGWIFTAFGGK